MMHALLIKAQSSLEIVGVYWTPYKPYVLGKIKIVCTVLDRNTPFRNKSRPRGEIWILSD
jgi:hypothetical protein